MNAAASRPPRTRRNRYGLSIVKRITLLLMIGLIGAVVVAAVWPTPRWGHGEGYVITDREIELHPSVEGAIDHCAVITGSLVEPGDVLIQLRDAVAQAMLAEAVSRLEAQRTQLKSRRSKQVFDIAQRKEQTHQAEMSLELARSQLQRMQGRSGFSAKEVEEADLDMRLAVSRLAELSVPLKDIHRLEIEVLEQQIVASQKEIDRRAAEVEQRKIRSPIAGTVYFHRFEPGEVVKPEHVLGQVFDRNAWVVRISLNERMMRYVKMDQSAEVHFAAYHRWGDTPLIGRVSQIDPIISPRATGDGVFGVEIAIDPSAELTLQPGLTAWADIDTGRTTWLQRILGW